MLTRKIDSSEDMIDSRDIIARIAELENDRDSYSEPCHKCDTLGTVEGKDCDWCNGSGYAAMPTKWADDNESDANELAALRTLAEDAEGYSPDWKYGATLIRDSYFEDYARELAEDIGAIKSDAEWPCYCIDWHQAARELQMDYTSVEFDGVTYWVR